MKKINTKSESKGFLNLKRVNSLLEGKSGNDRVAAPGSVFFHLNPVALRQLGPKVIKNFKLNSSEHEILNAHKYKNIKKFSSFQAQISLECYVGIFTFLSRKKFMLS